MVLWIFTMLMAAPGWRVWVTCLLCQKPSKLDAFIPLVLPTLWEAPGLGAHPMCSMASRGACKHQCLFPHLYIVVSLEGKQFARRPNLLCVPEVSKFWRWLGHFLPVAARHSYNMLTSVLLAWMSPAANRRFQIPFWKNVLTKNMYWKSWCQQVLSMRLGSRQKRKWR